MEDSVHSNNEIAKEKVPLVVEGESLMVCLEEDPTIPDGKVLEFGQGNPQATLWVALQLMCGCRCRVVDPRKKHNAISVEAGDFVMLADSHHKGKMGKLYPAFKGPYMVENIDGQNANCLLLDGEPGKTMHV